MSFIDNIKSEIDEASARYDLMNDKIMLFESVAYNNAIIKQKEAYLDAYKYGGDIEDYFTESEDESFGNKIKASIKKIADALYEFLEKCKEKLIEMMEKIRETSLMKKLENLFKANPKASQIKVEIEDTRKKKSLLEKIDDSIQKQKSKMKSGRITEKDNDEIDERDNKIAAILGGAAIVTTVTLGTLYVLLKDSDIKKLFSSTSTITKNLSKDWDSIQQNYQQTAERTGDHWSNADADGWEGRKANPQPSIDEWRSASVTHSDAYDPKIGHIITRGASQEANLKRAKAKLAVEWYSNVLEATKTGVSSAANEQQHVIEVLKGKKAVPAPHVESTSYDDSFNSDEYFSELCNDIFGKDDSSDDFDKMYSELCNDIFF